jgi:hypothetical protein
LFHNFFPYMHSTYWFVTKLTKSKTDNRYRLPTLSRQESVYLPNGFKNDSDSLEESGGSAPHENQDLELKKTTISCNFSISLLLTNNNAALFFFLIWNLA